MDFQSINDSFRDTPKWSVAAKKIKVNPKWFASIKIAAPESGGRFVCGTLDASRQGDGGTALESVVIADGVYGSHYWEHDQIGEPVINDNPHNPSFGDGGTPERSLGEFHKNVYYSYPVIDKPHHYEWHTNGMIHPDGESETKVKESQGTADEAFGGKPDSWSDEKKYITNVTPIYEYSWVDKYPREDGTEELSPTTEMQGWTTANKLPKASAAHAGEEKERYDMENITTEYASDAQWGSPVKIGSPDDKYHEPEALPKTGKKGQTCTIWQTYSGFNGIPFYQQTSYVCTVSSVEGCYKVPWVMAVCQRSMNPIKWSYEYKEYEAKEDIDYKQVKIKHTYRAVEPDPAYKLGRLTIHDAKSLRELILPAIGTIDVERTGIRNRNGAAVEIGGLDCLREEEPDWTGKLDPDWNARVD